LPETPVQAYLTLAFRELGFSTVTTNLLSIPTLALAILTLLAITCLSEAVNERSFVASLQYLWIMPCLIVLYHLPPHQPWAYFAATTVLLGSPSGQAIVVSWVSMNAGSVRTRTVGASLVGISYL
jgi:MFS transporter, ACS family, DAL5 transporter family protein